MSDINIDELRITKLRDYLVNAINEISRNTKINANALSKDIGAYSLDKIPTDYKVEKWINGTEIHRDLFSFRSRRNYSYEEMNNLLNIGFFEIFEEKIFDKDKKRELPDIKGIENIECMNCGAMNSANTNTAEFDIQIQITYKI